MKLPYDWSGEDGRDGETIDQEKRRVVSLVVMRPPLSHPTVDTMKAIHAEVLADQQEIIVRPDVPKPPRAT